MTHAHIATGHDEAKFGVPRDDVSRAVDLVETLAPPRARRHDDARRLAASRAIAPYLESARVLFGLVRSLRDAGRVRSLEFVDTGGGFGVDYAGGDAGAEGSRCPGRRSSSAPPALAQRAHGLDDLALFVEPGRRLVAPHGVLVARVIQAKVTAPRRAGS